MEHVNIADGNDRVGVQVGQLVTNADPRIEHANIADDTGFVPVQVGRVVIAEDIPTPPPVVPPPTSTDTGSDTDDAEEVRVVNMRAGNARVGVQADTITGSIHIRW